MQEQFAHTSVRHGNGTFIAVHRATCSACGATADVRLHGNSHPAPETTAHRLRRDGWAIGQRRRDDLCPQCLSKKTAPQRRSPAVSTEPQTNVTALRAANPPREATREHRRLITLKLEEIYVGEGDGYASGWDDERVARDLNVPRAWVVEVREFAFGPAISQKAPAELLAAIEARGREVANLVAGQASILGRLARLEQQAADLRADLDGQRTATNKALAEVNALRDQAARLSKAAGVK